MSEVPKRRLKRVCVWIPEGLHARLRKVAEFKRRTMADSTIIAIERYLEAIESEQAERKK